GSKNLKRFPIAQLSCVTVNLLPARGRYDRRTVRQVLDLQVTSIGGEFAMLHHPSRFLAATSVALACTLGASAPARAEYPDKPVKLVVNFTAGGPLDIMARLIGEKLALQFKQPFVVEN